jgi:dTDP-4-dehydrorhamnose 3,5-epimerase
MLYKETNLPGAYIITLQPKEDERGFFARTFCKKEMEQYRLHTNFVQCNVSYNRKKGTLRGLHFQAAPHGEVKIVSCHRGVLFDVIVDIRKESPTYGKWFGIELSADNHQALYVPEGFAHGFQTLTDDVEVFYLMGNFYEPTAARGIRWDDASIGIEWPVKNPIMSEQDKKFPELAI